jgi:hypothetical protein
MILSPFACLLSRCLLSRCLLSAVGSITLSGWAEFSQSAAAWAREELARACRKLSLKRHHRRGLAGKSDGLLHKVG